MIPDPARRVHADAEAEAGARRFGGAWTGGSLVAIAWFWWMVTEATGNLLRFQPLNGDFYDAQARSLLHGNLAVPASTLNIEAYVHDGKTYMYFGPLPAIFRLPIVAVTDSLDGRLGAGFMVIAFALTMAAVGVLAWRVRGLVRPDQPVGRMETGAVALFAVLVGIGSPLFFTGSRSWVYHEAALWALAFAVCAYDQIVALLADPTRGRLVRAAVFAGASALSRVSIGAGPIAALGVVLLVALVVRVWPAAGPRLRGLGVPERLHARGWLPALALAVAVPIVIFAAQNAAKFGTPFSIPFDTQLQNLFDAQRRRVLAANGGSLVTPAAIPTQLLQLVRPDAIRLTGTFPWVGFPTRRPTVVGDLLFDQRDYTAGVTATMPLLVALAVTGVVGAIRRRALAVVRVPILGALAVLPISLSFLYVAQRYTGDLLPLVVLGAVAGLPMTISALDRRSRAVRRGALAVFSVLVALGAWTGVALALEYQRNLTPLVPDPVRAQYVRWQSDVATFLGGGAPSVGRGPELPEAGARNALFVVGACRGLYASDGDAWRGVERTEAAGHFRLRVTLPRRPVGTVEPLVTAGTGAGRWELAVRTLPDGRAVFVAPGRGLRGTPFAVEPGRAQAIDVVLDRHVGEMQVSRDGVRVFRDDYDGTSDRFTLGVDPEDPARRFTGVLRREPVRPDLCRTVVARSR